MRGGERKELFRKMQDYYREKVKEGKESLGGNRLE